jgi:hypothetical protein
MHITVRLRYVIAVLKRACVVRKSVLRERAECISMSTARDAAVQQTFHTRPPLFAGLEIGTNHTTWMAIAPVNRLLTAVL